MHSLFILFLRHLSIILGSFFSSSSPISSSPLSLSPAEQAMDRDGDLLPSSPSNSSISSSDLDTESTGSFFPDRSTTLGTLMGVSFPEAAAAAGAAAGGGGPARIPSRREHGVAAARPKARATERRRQPRRNRGRRGWWRLCRDDMAGPTSLGEFLQVERRLAGGDVADGHYVFGPADPEHVAVGGGPLFADGRVLPPAPPPERRSRPQRAESVGRLPALLISGICSGGEG